MSPYPGAEIFGKDCLLKINWRRILNNKVAVARKLYADKSNKISEICKTLHISRATLYRYVK
jgi:DNA invertase Pin-like site-specific DNA recombinase